MIILNKFSVLLIKTPPGAIELTRIPLSAQYVAKYFVRLITPALETP